MIELASGIWRSVYVEEGREENIQGSESVMFISCVSPRLGRQSKREAGEEV
jgi:hypothetical protein